MANENMATEKPKRGRRKKGANLDLKIYVRLAKDEVEEIDKLCQQLGIEERSGFLRFLIRDGLKRLYQRDIWEMLREQAHNK